MGQTKGRSGVGVVWVVVFSVLILVGCSNSATEAPGSHAMATMNRVAPEVVGGSCPGPGDMEARYVLYLILDRTGSYFTDSDTVSRIKADAKRYVREAPPGTALYLAYIAEASRTPQEIMLREAIPIETAATPCEAANPFDRAQRRHCAQVKQQLEARQVCILQAYQRIEKQIDALVPIRARRTDIDGALILASEVLGAYPKAEKGVVILSDGEDTVNKSVLTPTPPGFTNTKVVLRPPLGKLNGKIERYQVQLASWGAEVTIVPMSLPSAKLFQSYGSQSGIQDHALGVAVANR